MGWRVVEVDVVRDVQQAAEAGFAREIGVARAHRLQTTARRFCPATAVRITACQLCSCRMRRDALRGLRRGRNNIPARVVLIRVAVAAVSVPR